MELNLQELINLREEIQSIYNREKEDYVKNQKAAEKSVISEELSDIAFELEKVNKLIDIFQNNTYEELIEVKLERLYIQMQTTYSAEELDNMNEDKLFEVYDNLFPNEWVYKLDIQQKIALLLTAICDNKMINIKSSKRTLNNYDGK